MASLSHLLCFFLSSPSPLLPLYFFTDYCMTSYTNSHSNHTPLSNPTCLCMRLSTAAACFIPLSFKIHTVFFPELSLVSGGGCGFGFWNGSVLFYLASPPIPCPTLPFAPPPLPLAPASLPCSPPLCLRPLLTQALSVDRDTPPRPGDGGMHSSGRSLLPTNWPIGGLETKHS